MPWWSWIVIWIALVALSLLFFGVLGVRLYRQFMTTVKELGDAAERFSRLPSGGPDPVQPESGPPGNPYAGSAVFDSPAQMRHDYHASKLSRQEARRLRRIQRRTERRQPQRLHDIEFS